MDSTDRVDGVIPALETEEIRSGSLDICLTVRPPSGAPEDMRVSVPRGTNVERFAETLARRWKLEASSAQLPFVLRSQRLGLLAGERDLAEVGLRHGDQLALEQQARAPGGSLQTTSAPARVELIVLEGPSAGRRTPLAAGTYVIGRGSNCDVRLDEDPSLSREHLELRVNDHDAWVRDLGSSNGTSLAGKRLAAGGRARAALGERLKAGKTVMTLASAGSAAERDGLAVDGIVRFNRPPRVRRPDSSYTIDVGEVPAKTKGFRPPLGAAVIPLLLGGAVAYLMKQPAMLLFAALSPAMAAWTFIADRHSGRSRFKRARADFTARLREAGGQLAQARESEIRELQATAPGPAELVERVCSMAPNLWERRPTDADFLRMRFGVAQRPSSIEIRSTGAGEPELRRALDSLAAEHSQLPSVPTTASLREVGVMGVAGPSEHVGALGRWLVAQAAALHSPRELGLVAVISPRRAAQWEWLKWLPHTLPGESMSADAQLACTAPTARAVLRSVDQLVRDRRADLADRFGLKPELLGASVVVLIDETLGLERSHVANILEHGPAAGVFTIWLGEREHDLPGYCGLVLSLSGDGSKLSATTTGSGETLTDVALDEMPLAQAEAMARAISPIRDTGATGARAEIPHRVLLPDLLGLARLNADSVATAWSSRQARRGLKATLGLALDGPFEVDLRADGPHALVAGMTGAGKSELLQTLLASLALRYPPSRVSFLLIDYKGGAAFKDFKGLPHVVGMVTDLDAHLTHRALTSLNAELRRREALLRRFDARDIAEMERAAPDEAPANLVLVIDEFAALVREIPSFVDGVVDVAQRGRSLGVHLVLATQRPSGVVSENIRANTNLRIALRVATTNDSEDVVSASDAARIPRSMPGRAFARTGASDLTEFQAAFVGAPAALDGKPSGIDVRPFQFDLTFAKANGGESTVIGRPTTELNVIVEAASEAAAKGGYRPPSSPWLPALEAVIALEALEEQAPPEARRDLTAIVGRVDEPSAQRQRTLIVDLEQEGSALIYGASGAGKTVLLITLAASIATHSSPGRVHIYGLDFASRGLMALEALPHCGGVIAGDDDERVRRLLRMLRREIDRRKRLLGDAGALTLAAYEAREDVTPLPRIVTLLDSYAGFTAAYERVAAGVFAEVLARIVADGRPVGVHVVATADRRAAIPVAVSGVVPRKLVLRMADEDEYQSLGVDSRAVRGAVLPPGRGFTDGSLEFQTAILGGDPGPHAQTSALRRLEEKMSARWPGQKAPVIGLLPTRVTLADLPRPSERMSSTFALGDEDLGPVTATLADTHFVVAGPYRSGRTTALATIVAGLAASTPELELHLLAPRRSELPESLLWTSVAAGEEQCVRAAKLLSEMLAERTAASAPMLVVIDDASELGDGPAAQPLELVARRGRDLNVRVVMGIEAGAARIAFTPWIKEVRKDGHGLLLDADEDLHGDILGVRLPRRTGPALPPGRGYFVRGGVVELVQVALP